MLLEEHVIYRYKYLPYSEGALKTLSDSTIKFTCPLEFNDPFDCIPYHDPESIENYPKVRPDMFKAVAELQGLSPAKRLQRKTQMLAKLRNSINNRTFYTAVLKQVGVVSLSRNPVNILMWSHYADHHRGFVLEFRIPILGTMDEVRLSAERLLPFPVSYSKDRPCISIGTEPDDQGLQKWLLTKSEDWRYEEEERVINRYRGPGIHKYRRDEILSSVIAGIKMQHGEFEYLKSLVSDLTKKSRLDLALFRAQESVGKYKLNVPNHPRINPALLP